LNQSDPIHPLSIIKQSKTEQKQNFPSRSRIVKRLVSSRKLLHSEAKLRKEIEDAQVLQKKANFKAKLLSKVEPIDQEDDSAMKVAIKFLRNLG